MSETADFRRAAIEIKKCKKKPSSNDQLKLYGLYKIATGGESKEPSGPFDYEQRAKYNEYQRMKNSDILPSDAAQQYVALVEELKPKYNYHPDNPIAGK